ncbi:hypothetical protein DWZ35_25270, partial [Bacteroides caccae]
FFQFLQELTSTYDQFIAGKEITSTYDQFIAGKEITVEQEKGLTFSDYVFVERFRRQTKRYQNAMDFALKVFKDLPEKISIPTKMSAIFNK